MQYKISGNIIIIQKVIITKYIYTSSPISMPQKKIQSLILSQFHKNKGFTIIKVIQRQNYVTQSQFNIYSELILFREELSGRFLVSQFMDKYYLISIPLLSQNTQQKNIYFRTKYLYAISVVVEKRRYLADGGRGKSVYKEIVSKLAHFFKSIQESSNILYENYLPQNLSYLTAHLTKAYNNINSNSQFLLSHFSNCFTIINLNISPYPIIYSPKKPIKKSQVPITHLLQSQIQDIQSQFGKKLLRFAKVGDFNIGKICQIVGDDISVMKYYGMGIQIGVVFMVDMFGFQNRYSLTEGINKYVGQRRRKQQAQLQAMCEQVALKKVGTQSTASLNQNFKLTPNILLYIYFQLSRKDPLKKIVDSHLSLFSQINLLKFLRISQVLGLITRVHQKFAIEDAQSNVNQFQFITQQRLRIYMQHPSKIIRANFANIYPGNMNSGIKQELERLNSLFNAHLRNMDTIQEICVSMKMSRAILLGLIGFGLHKGLKILYVSQ